MTSLNTLHGPLRPAGMWSRVGLFSSLERTFFSAVLGVDEGAEFFRENQGGLMERSGGLIMGMMCFFPGVLVTSPLLMSGA